MNSSLFFYRILDYKSVYTPFCIWIKCTEIARAFVYIIPRPEYIFEMYNTSYHLLLNKATA